MRRPRKTPGAPHRVNLALQGGGSHGAFTWGEFVQRLLREQRVDPRRYRRVRMHMIEAEARLRTYGASSKLNTSPAFIGELFALGRATGREWLEMKFACIGHASSVHIAKLFL
jgi:NTE family protein